MYFRQGTAKRWGHFLSGVAATLTLACGHGRVGELFVPSRG